MFFGLLLWPGNSDTEAGNDSGPTCSIRMAIVPNFSVDDFLDDHIAGFACFLIREWDD